jgi:hypothetical protein
VFSHFIHILSHFPVKKATGKTLAKSITYETEGEALSAVLFLPFPNPY